MNYRQFLINRYLETLGSDFLASRLRVLDNLPERDTSGGLTTRPTRLGSKVPSRSLSILETDSLTIRRSSFNRSRSPFWASCSMNPKKPLILIKEF